MPLFPWCIVYPLTLLAAGRFFSTLGEHGVNIEMISQGASEINISCVIEERDANRALNVVHTNLFTFLG